MKKESQQAPVKLAGKGRLIATFAMFLLVILLWRDQSRMKAHTLILEQQNIQLQKSMAVTQSALESATDALDFLKSGDFRKSDQETIPNAAPVIPEPIEEVETLLLQTPTVSQTAEGLVARLAFESISVVSDQMTMVVRVPQNSDSKILKLAPAGNSSDTDVVCIVNLQGTLAIIEGTSDELHALDFELTVSAPVKATVRGSDGIRDFEIDITPSDCTVRKL
jgi:hypothetical protein